MKVLYSAGVVTAHRAYDKGCGLYGFFNGLLWILLGLNIYWLVVSDHGRSLFEFVVIFDLVYSSTTSSNLHGNGEQFARCSRRRRRWRTEVRLRRDHWSTSVRLYLFPDRSQWQRKVTRSRHNSFGSAKTNIALSFFFFFFCGCWWWFLILSFSILTFSHLSSIGLHSPLEQTRQWWWSNKSIFLASVSRSCANISHTHIHLFSFSCCTYLSGVARE